MNNIVVNKFVCPALAIIAGIVALVGPWFATTTSITKTTIDSTLLEILRGDSSIEYTSKTWLWLSIAGAVLVILSMFVNDVQRKPLAQAGSYIFLSLPVWSLFNVFTDSEDIQAGWALWVTAGISVLVLLLASRIPEGQQASDVTSQSTDSL